MVILSLNPIYFSYFFKVVLQNEQVSFDNQLIERNKEAHAFLQNFIKDKVIYGINTGLGPMAQYRVDDKDQVKLQKNLIRSHAAGVGKHMPKEMVKGAMFCRLVSLSRGYSGVSLQTLETLKEFINHNITPVVSQHGGVGASGDLVQLSQIALCLIGEGKVYYEDKLQNTKDVLNQLNIKPLEITLREGLALINGTSFMTSVGILNILNAQKALNSTLLNGCLINEVVESFDDHFSIELNQVKKHATQQYIANEMQAILKDSKLISKREETYYNSKYENENIFKKKVQEYYSIRCMPQVLGPIYKTISEAEEVLLDELNSVSDNPIIDIENQNIYHGGNFHGDFVSCEMSKLKNVMIKMSVLVERQLNFMLNHKLNEIFAPFLNAGVLGLNLGLQGAQYAATSTTAENQNLSSSVYVHSIPSNNDNQDLVSMGTNEALLTNKVIQNTFDVIAVLSLSLCQACNIQQNHKNLSSKTRKHIETIGKDVPFIKEDVEIRPLLESIVKQLKLN
ncbi:MAG: aromatic amino acid lyase [Bacteroidetes bacterium]|nr:aromatic amino acid lyase [Bacteroidota bacterium]